MLILKGLSNNHAEMAIMKAAKIEKKPIPSYTEA
jgi:hypothetical protein